VGADPTSTVASVQLGGCSNCCLCLFYSDSGDGNLDAVLVLDFTHLFAIFVNELPEYPDNADDVVRKPHLMSVSCERECANG
jgi:hypothetical protein